MKRLFPMFRYNLIFFLLLLAACDVHSEKGSTHGRSLQGAARVQLWATHYYLLNANEVESGISLKSMSEKIIGPNLSRENWCDAAVQGSVRINKTTYTYAGKRLPRQADCKINTSEKVRWKISRHRYGTGSKSNPLEPFRTLACDLGSVPNSKPWYNGGFPSYGQKVFIPLAVGIQIPGGHQHDGIFICSDVGNHITGNHVDLFLGDAFGRSDALTRNPFDFVGHNARYKFDAYILK